MIISIGEVVWDIFGDRRVLGGAPVNVAYHLRCLGVDVKVISRVGRDELGRETRKRLQELGLPLDGIQEGGLPTGQVNVSIGVDHEPHFDILAPAAWDAIDFEAAVQAAKGLSFHLVFGTLAQRDTRSRKAVRKLWEMADARLYDVNLRPPFTTRDIVTDSLQAADMVKVNGAELAEIAAWHNIAFHDKKEAARKLLKKYFISVLVVTEGPKGAWLVTKDQYFGHPGAAAKVVDTVGAGDAFFATLIEGYINKTPWPECLARANERGAYVASQKGATPPMPK